MGFLSTTFSSAGATAGILNHQQYHQPDLIRISKHHMLWHQALQVCLVLPKKRPRRVGHIQHKVHRAEVCLQNIKFSSCSWKIHPANMQLSCLDHCYMRYVTYVYIRYCVCIYIYVYISIFIDPTIPYYSLEGILLSLRLCKHNKCYPLKQNPRFQRTIGCTPNSVPMVFILSSRDSWGF